MTKLADKQRKTCKHKIIIINPMGNISQVYCKRCHKNLEGLEYHDFITKKINDGKWEKEYDTKAEVWGV